MLARRLSFVALLSCACACDPADGNSAEIVAGSGSEAGASGGAAPDGGGGTSAGSGGDDAGSGATAGAGARAEGEAVFAGGDHTCAVRLSGAVYCWGRYDFGQLGDGEFGVNEIYGRNSPVQVRGLDDAVLVNAGRDHSCAVRESGAVVCWGGGLLGDGMMMRSATPVTVVGLDDALTVSGGYNHTCALREGGAVVCWGLALDGQLGDGVIYDSMPFGSTTPAGRSASSCGSPPH